MAEHTVRTIMNGPEFPFRSHNNFLKYFKQHYPNNEIVSPSQILDDGAVYIYPIEIRTNLNRLYDQQSFSLDGKEYTYYFNDTFSPTILKYLQLGKVKLVINYVHDPITYPDEIEKFDSMLESIGVDGSNVIIASGNDYSVPSSKIKFSCGSLFVREDAERVMTRPHINRLGYMSDYVREHNLDPSVIRPQRFLCFNRQLANRKHRVTLGYIALKYNLLSNSIFSFLEKISEIEVLDTIRYWNTYYKDVDVDAFAKQLTQILPYEIDTQALSQSEKTNFQTNNNKKDLYLNTYIHIISETRFHDGDSPFISEKTFRPIANLQPFIYVGNYNSLKTLQGLGFKTFHPYINEEYDSETDPEKRMSMIEQEIKKLNDLPIEKLHDLYYNLKDVLIYNRQHLTTFINQNPYENLMRDLQNGI